MKKGTQEFDQIYSGSTAQLSKDLVGIEATESLFSNKRNKSLMAREVRFDKIPNTEQLYHKSSIPLRSNDAPSTTGFNMEYMSGNVQSLEGTVNSIANVTNRPKVIRVIKSEDNSAYAIFTK